MNPQISAPIAINVIGLLGVIALSGFITSRVLAAAPDIPVPAPSYGPTHAISQQSYSGVIAWAGATEIRITDNFGVSRVFEITKDTHILMNGFPVGAATYEDLRVLDHAKVTAIDDGTGIKAQTIVVQ